MIKDRIITNIRTLLEEQEEKGCYKPKRVRNFWNNSYIEYESNWDKNRTLSLDEHLNKIEPYLRNIIIDLQNSDTWKIHLTNAIKSISSNYTEEEWVTHSRGDNIQLIMMQMKLLRNSLSHCA